ncbi:MAG: D-glycero-beta-D-manno-heptose 1,7-bisphosphate 7-phosphatase [Candidatus Omnitrophica bacterium]|nr:D-glycero-beta-D-manno-heptose 1,7-bisphosphate 7-phosphatase [Candidatus Omnitrophota bacterium]
MKRTKTEKVVFVDRDGVINEDLIGDYVKRREDFKFLPGVLGALKQLVQSGFQIVIISNQAGIGDGEYTKEALKEITDHMLDEFKKNGIHIRGIYYCLHGKNANCNCRKPKTGLLEQAAKDIQFNPSQTYLIGDKISDFQAGKNFGLKTLFVLTGHGKLDQAKITPQEKPEQIFPSLKEAVEYLKERTS